MFRESKRKEVDVRITPTSPAIRRLLWWRFENADSHVCAAEAVTKHRIHPVVGHAGALGQLVGELGREAAERSAQREDRVRVVVVVDADDEVSTGSAHVPGVVDDVDLAQHPEVTRRWVHGLRHD